MLREIGLRPDWTNYGREAVIRAKEALEQMQLKPETAEKTAEAYDTARYSEHELKDEAMDALRKELKL